VDDITLFLEGLSVGRTGKAFLIDQGGRLMAISTGVPLIDSGNFPVSAPVSAEKDIAAAAEHVEKNLGSFRDVDARYQLDLTIGDKPYLLMVSPSKHATGLTWIIGTLVPESDFLSEIRAGRQRSIKIGILAVVITLLLGVVLAAISLWPMLDLARYVRRAGEGDLDQDLKLEYSTEFVKLSQQINAMTAGLRDRLRLRHSLSLAQEVQQNLLPSDIPKVDGLDILLVKQYELADLGDFWKGCVCLLHLRVYQFIDLLLLGQIRKGNVWDLVLFSPFPHVGHINGNHGRDKRSLLADYHGIHDKGAEPQLVFDELRREVAPVGQSHDIGHAIDNDNMTVIIDNCGIT
jgi:hypothetical protein